MLQRIKAFFRDYRDFWPYLLFGGLTTLVNYGVYLPLYNTLGLSATASNLAAWAVSVLFAFWTNKAFVYRSRDWSARTVLREAVRFLGCRAGSGVTETAVLFLCVDLLSLNGNLVKLLTSGFVIAVNYATGRMLVFRKK